MDFSGKSLFKIKKIFKLLLFSIVHKSKFSNLHLNLSFCSCNFTINLEKLAKTALSQYNGIFVHGFWPRYPSGSACPYP